MFEGCETLVPKSTISASVSTSGSAGSDHDDDKDKDQSSFTIEQRNKIEFNKSIAKAKRNLKICTERVMESKDDGSGFVKLEEILVKETWLEALSRDFQGTWLRKEYVEVYLSTHLLI